MRSSLPGLQMQKKRQHSDTGKKDNIQILTVRIKEIGLDSPISEQSSRTAKERMQDSNHKAMKEQASRFIQLLSLGFFSPYILFSYILIPPHLGCAFILFFAVFAEFTVKAWDICRTYARDILAWSHVYSSKRDQRAESWSGLSPSGPHLSWGAEPHRGCECWLSWSPPNWDLSTLTSFPAAFSAQLTASTKFLTADLTWPFAPSAAPVRMIIPTQIHAIIKL